MKNSNDNTGKSFETLITTLEKILLNNPNVTLETRKKILDKKGKRKREFDIVLTFHEHHHKILVGIECRDRSRKIGSPEMEGFWAKCQDTCINKGVMVSPLSFTKPALNKADHYGIKCLSLDEALQFNWLLTSKATIIEREIQKLSLILNTENPLEDPFSDFQIVDINGNEIDKKVFDNLARQKIQEFVWSKEDEGLKNVKYLFTGNGVFLKNKITNEMINVILIEVFVDFEIKSKSIPFQYYNYNDIEVDKKLGEVAVAPLNVTGFDGQIILTNQENGTFNINIVQNVK